MKTIERTNQMPVFLAQIAVIWGVFVGCPLWDVFALAPNIYAHFRQFPPLAWGVISVVAGLGQWIGYRRRYNLILWFCAWLLTALFLFQAACFLTAVPYAPAWLIYLLYLRYQIPLAIAAGRSAPSLIPAGAAPATEIPPITRGE